MVGGSAAGVETEGRGEGESRIAENSRRRGVVAEYAAGCCACSPSGFERSRDDFVEFDARGIERGSKVTRRFLVAADESSDVAERRMCFADADRFVRLELLERMEEKEGPAWSRAFMSPVPSSSVKPSRPAKCFPEGGGICFAAARAFLCVSAFPCKR